MKGDIREDVAAALAVPCVQPIIVPPEQFERAREQAKNSRPTREVREENAKKVRGMFGKPGNRGGSDGILH